MKKKYTLILAFIMVLLMTACNQNVNQDDAEKNGKESKTENEITKHEEVTIKTSPDKYTWYVKDYVGKIWHHLDIRLWAETGWIIMARDISNWL